MACNNSKKCDRKSVDILSKVLANSYFLQLKTQNVHWNIVSQNFRSLHLLTEEHYNDLAAGIDVIAERIRMLGGFAPATFEEFSKLATINEVLKANNDKDMLKELLADHETLRDEIKAGIAQLEDLDDYVTQDVLTCRLSFHEKAIWMIGSTLN